MNSWKIILATVVIFGAGVLTGGLLVNYVDLAHGPNARFPFWGGDAGMQTGNQEPARSGELPRPRPPEIWRKEFIEHLDKTLNLTPAQHAAISKIIAEGQERNREIWTNVAPRLRDEMEQAQRRICAQLTPEQQKQFEEMIKSLAVHHPPHDQPPGLPPAAKSVPPPPPAGETGP